MIKYISIVFTIAGMIVLGVYLGSASSRASDAAASEPPRFVDYVYDERTMLCFARVQNRNHVYLNAVLVDCNAPIIQLASEVK